MYVYIIMSCDYHVTFIRARILNSELWTGLKETRGLCKTWTLDSGLWTGLMDWTVD